MYAILTAGGIPIPEDPLYPVTQGHPKAMLDVAGRPMVQWVLDALCEASAVHAIVLVGLTEKSGLTCSKPIHYLSNQGKMLDNLRAATEKVLELDRKAGHIVIVSSDIPALTGELVDWVVNAAMQTDEDVYYNIITREVMEKRFPNSRRTYTHLKDMDVCGSDINVARASLIVGESGLWEKITDARKSPLKQAALIGYDTLFLLLLRKLTVDKAVANVMKRLGITGRAIICPYAEVGMDVDKPHQLEILREDLKKRQRKVARQAKKTASKTPDQ